jgi:hypothetical protein
MRKSVTIAVAAALSLSALLHARPSVALDIGVSITVAPPALPVYEQPPLPSPGYIWTPGYWAWSDDGYYWVPGTWVEPPEPGLLWTPGYWGWENGLYLWHAGYWGPTIGFYGGVNYGYGYFGRGYAGGYWDRGAFRYNRAYNHFGNDIHVTNVYNRTVVNNVTVNRVSYNGGQGGIRARADQHEMAAQQAHHFEPIAAQTRQSELARGNPELRASANHGRPGIAATSRPGDFETHVVAAHGAVRGPNQGNVPHGNSPQENAARGNAPQGYHPGNPGQANPGQGNPAQFNHAAPQQHADNVPNAVPHQNEQHFQNNAPQPQVTHAPAPQQQFHPAPQQHVQPQAVTHAPTPQPQFHAPQPPPQQFHAPAPPPHPQGVAPQAPAQHAPGPPQQHEHGGPQDHR